MSARQPTPAELREALRLRILGHTITLESGREVLIASVLDVDDDYARPRWARVKGTDRREYEIFPDGNVTRAGVNGRAGTSAALSLERPDRADTG